MLWRKRVFFKTPDGVLNKPRTTCFVLSNGLLKRDIIIVYDKRRKYKGINEDEKQSD